MERTLLGICGRPRAKLQRRFGGHGDTYSPGVNISLFIADLCQGPPINNVSARASEGFYRPIADEQTLPQVDAGLADAGTVGIGYVNVILPPIATRGALLELNRSTARFSSSCSKRDAPRMMLVTAD